jgi:TPR repeat protein
MLLIRLLTAFLLTGGLLAGCSSIDFDSPVAPAGDPAAGILTLSSGRSYPIYPEALSYTGAASYQWPDGRTYEGDFVLGSPEGMGTGTWPNGDRYRGTWHEGKRHGHGELSRTDGSRYVGDFDTGVRAGDGVEQSGEGLYRGHWSDDLPNGYGEFHATDGASYSGQWHNGSRQGYGDYVDANGNRYRGDWHADVPDGFGILENANGSRYEGEWQASQQHGYGRSENEAGTVYEGTWVQGKRHGFGIASRYDGSRYEGEWSEGRRAGNGRESFANGSYHEGVWEADQPLGPGTRRDRTGIEINGVWTGDTVRSGFMRLPSGAEYAGGILKNRNTMVEESLLAWLESRAAEDDPHAQFFLGTAYVDYSSPVPDPFRATGYFRSAARGGVPEAQFRLALLLLDKTPEQALTWLTRAADAGHAQASALLGEYYLTGQHVPMDLPKALGYLETATAAGDPSARNNLAWVLATSESFRDGPRALALIRPLALADGDWQHFDTLAAAYAATQAYTAAVDAQTRAIREARQTQTNEPTLSDMRERLVRYERLSESGLEQQTQEEPNE